MLLLIFTAALLPVAAGIYRYFKPATCRRGRRMTPGVIAVSALLCGGLAVGKGNFADAGTLFSMTKDISFVFRVDTMGVLFSLLFCAAFFLVGVYSMSYFAEDSRKNKFDCFYLLSLGALILLSFSANLPTMYVNFEAVTLCSMPLVLHDRKKESVDAAMKYLLYSVGGAFLGFIGVVYLGTGVTAETFAYGGILKDGFSEEPGFAVVLLLMLIGFGAKCGMFPLHNWLPTAHPVAPAPASALLSGVITKSGVIAVIRIVFFTVGAENLRGTAVHKAWIILAMITVLLGSFMAAVQNNFKRRLAFSTVSQVSYVLLGLSMLNGEALGGALLQVCSHAVIKICLFLTAGVLIHLLGIHDVDEMEGVGKKLPITMWCYTVCALGLVGVPPTSGFTAKWYLAMGALNSGLGVFGVLVPVVLIISAILTAYYLLAPAIKAFFPSDKRVVYEKVREPLPMVIPMIVLAVLTVLMGLYPAPILSLVGLL